MTDKNPPKQNHTLDTKPNITEARRRVELHIKRYRDFERRDIAKSETALKCGDHPMANSLFERAERWRRIYKAYETDLLGIGGCVVASFDLRRPEIVEMMRSETT